MRDLKDYSTGEWFKLVPLVHFFKQVRNDAVQRAYLALRPKSLKRFLHNAEHMRGGNVGLVVAYEQPWALDWLTRMAARHLVDGTLLVFDNSRRQRARIDIERVCRDRNVPYLALPPNPTRHVNRSHGIAMTWIFHNVVRAIRPRIFGFVDHDLIPMEKIELGETLGDQPFYGVPNVSKWGWQLWAGYCLFDFSVVHHLPLNFLNDFYRGLDTGGRNWSCLYKNYDRAQLRFGAMQQTDVMDPLHSTPRTIQVVDGSWIHLAGAGYSSDFHKMLDFYKRIAKAADEGATLQMLAMKRQPR
jgi:hypothetical protein